MMFWILVSDTEKLRIGVMNVFNSVEELIRLEVAGKTRHIQRFFPDVKGEFPRVFEWQTRELSHLEKSALVPAVVPNR